MEGSLSLTGIAGSNGKATFQTSGAQSLNKTSNSKSGGFDDVISTETTEKTTPGLISHINKLSEYLTAFTAPIKDHITEEKDKKTYIQAVKDNALVYMRFTALSPLYTRGKERMIYNQTFDQTFKFLQKMNSTLNTDAAYQIARDHNLSPSQQKMFVNGIGYAWKGGQIAAELEKSMNYVYQMYHAIADTKAGKKLIEEIQGV